MRTLQWQATGSGEPVTIDVFFVSHLDPDMKHSDLVDIQNGEYEVTKMTMDTLDDHVAITMYVAQLTFQE